MDWRLQILKQAIFARLPFGATLRHLKRRQFSYEPDPSNLRGTLSNLEQMTAALQTAGRSFEGATVLEIGSGWFPTIPIMLTLNGAKRVLMSDLTPHTDDVTVAATLRFLRSTFPNDSRLNRINKLADLPITYMAPFHVDKIGDGTLDLVISRTVLEHIPPTDLERLLSALRPKLKANGLMVHVIDNSDHFEHNDKSISRINFLTWTERKHAFINSLIKGGENRLRHHEYPHLFERAGLRIVSTAMQIDEPTRAIVKTLPLASPYSTMSPDELAALTSIYVLAPISASESRAEVQSTAADAAYSAARS